MAYDSKELQRLAGITGRQMDYWYKRYWLVSFERKTEEGSGVPLEWPTRTVRKAIIMGRLVKAGFVPEKAHEIAEWYLTRVPPGGRQIKVIGKGIQMAINLEETSI